MAYIHEVIPLNISFYEHQISLFETFLKDFTAKTTINVKEASFTKAIRDLATFSFKQLDKLQVKLLFIDIVLQEGNISTDLNHRHKIFVGLIGSFNTQLSVPGLFKQAKASKDGNFFDNNCNSKNTSQFPS